jgi:glycosyltransferase involved in cell wall biosynthesis
VPLAVGVDAANLLRDRRGIGRYVRALLREWQLSFQSRIELTLLVSHPFPGLVAKRLAAAAGTGTMRVAHRRHATRLGLDLVWYPWNGMTWAAPVRSVVTLHDVWPFYSPAPDLRLRAREQRHYLFAKDRATRFIAVSEFTKSEAANYLGLERDRIDVVPHGVEALTPSLPQTVRLDGIGRYVLFVGEAEKRKDIDSLLTAMSALPDQLRSATALVIAGKSGNLVAEGFRLERLGEVSDDRLASLYAGAAVFAFPSRYEGFGFPVLEAMYYGAPVVASDVAGIPEAGGQAALYFRPGDAGALTAALTRVLTDESTARKLAAAGKVRAAGMTQRLCAQRTLEVFERVARG